MKSHCNLRSQRGVTLVIGLILLVLITLVVTSAFSLSTANLRSIGNMQVRDEAIAAANIALEMEVSSPFTNAPGPIVDRRVDIDNDGSNDYRVDIGTPVCVRASQAIADSLSSVTLGSSMSSSPYWNTVWEFDALVTDLKGSGATARVHEGVRVLLTQAQKNIVCG